MIGPSDHRADPLAAADRDELSAPDDGPSAFSAKAIVVTGRNVGVPEHFRTHAAQKLANVGRLDDRAVKYTIELFHESNPRQSKVCQRVEIAITGPGPTLRAEGSGPDFYVALAAALAKLHVRQRRNRDRRRVRHGRRHPQPLPEASWRQLCAGQRKMASPQPRWCRPSVATRPPSPPATGPTWDRSSGCPARAET
jgi:ribosomal subunit interface protein